MDLLYKLLKEKIKNHYSFFIILYNIRAYALHFVNRFSGNQLEKIRFFQGLSYPLNLKHPQSYNEKILWKKIYDRNPLLPITSDKVRVRSYVREILGEKQAKEILIPILYVSDEPETIPFEKLSPPFIIKPNHASGSCIIVNEDNFDKNQIIKTCRRWLNTPYGLEKMEWANRAIKRKIFIEKLLLDDDGKIAIDFKFNMFHGKCKLVNVFFDRMNNKSMSSFDGNWNFIQLKINGFVQGPKIKKPKNYEVMLELAEKLAEAFDHVRVDFYNQEGKIYFGELTHYSASGICKFKPASFDFELGKYWKIEKDYWKNDENKNRIPNRYINQYDPSFK